MAFKKTMSWTFANFILGLFIIGASALYDSNDDVVELTASNFKKQVLDSDSVWIVEFYAPWLVSFPSFT